MYVYRYSQTSGQAITNAVVQEVCISKPDMLALDLSGCNHVDDVGLWAIARHSCNLRELVLKGPSYCLRLATFACCVLTEILDNETFKHLSFS